MSDLKPDGAVVDESVLVIDPGSSVSYTGKFVSMDNFADYARNQLEKDKSLIVIPLYKICEWARDLIDRDGE